MKKLKILISIFVLFGCSIVFTACEINDKKVTVNFIVADEVYHTVVVDQNSEIVFPEDPEKEHYIFVGWYQDEGVWEIEVTEESVKSADFNSFDENFNVYAMFLPIQFNVVYNLDGAINHTDNRETFTVEDSYFVLQTPQKEGYTFEGWFTDEEFTNSIEGVDPATACDYELFAKFTITNYTINYVLNDYCYNSDSNPTSCTILDAIALEDPEVKYYTFDGWYTDADFINQVDSLSNVSTDVTLYAKLTAIDYNVTYVLNGGTNHSENPTTISKDEDFEFKPAYRLGYMFNGWICEGNILNNFKQSNNYFEVDNETLTLNAAWVKVYKETIALQDFNYNLNISTEEKTIYNNFSDFEPLEQPVVSSFEFSICDTGADLDMSIEYHITETFNNLHIDIFATDLITLVEGVEIFNVHIVYDITSEDEKWLDNGNVYLNVGFNIILPSTIRSFHFISNADDLHKNINLHYNWHQCFWEEPDYDDFMVHNFPSGESYILTEFEKVNLYNYSTLSDYSESMILSNVKMFSRYIAVPDYITEIGYYDFMGHFNNVKAIYISKFVKTIDARFFDYFNNHPNRRVVVMYEGSISDWEKIEFLEYNFNIGYLIMNYDILLDETLPPIPYYG